MANASEDESSLHEIDWQGIEYVDPVDDTLLCPVCKTPFHSPITTQCGHTFCAVCINRALETQATCPIDRQPINKNQDYYRLPLIIKDQLDRLRGCDYEGSREHLEGHCERRCEFTRVRCPDPECDKLIARRYATPEQGCLHEDTACQYCSKVMTYVELGTHWEDECDGVTVQCPDCDATVARHRLERHQSHDCAEGYLECKWQSAGCKVAGKRRVVLEHQDSGCAFEVVGHLLQQRAEDRRVIDDLSMRLASLEASRSRRRGNRERQDLSARANGDVTPHSNIPGVVLNGDMPLVPGSAADAGALDSPEDYMLSQFERLDTQMDQLQKNTRDMEARLALSFLQHTTRVGEQFAELASKVGVINMHTAWLMNMQRQNYAQQRAGLAAGPSSQADASHSSDASATGPGSSSSDGAGMRYQAGSRRNSDGSRENRTRL
ncbi:hypothetical protein NEMBOFW57_010036 [Staphylotrichum longicolle]|uniref:Uncharacterized protein n=1 Tax=Staphylotrichum longicolle TaxID=669026 RepID=A0AAD4HTQ4_9PEZI|nr:hypothetical protein NEMBOFW57_010036 [Staphylotrichum longicolle]